MDIVEENVVHYNIRHRCFHFSKSLILLVREIKIEKPFFSIVDQLIRSGTSIGANLVEGSAGSSRRDWLKFLAISLKSANETKYWLCLLRDSFDIEKNEVKLLIEEANEIS